MFTKFVNEIYLRKYISILNCLKEERNRERIEKKSYGKNCCNGIQ